MSKKDKLSRKISYLLRHNPEDLKMDKNGWVITEELLQKLNITLEELKIIVNTNNKKRFSFNSNNSKIRANQGHSIDVDVELKKIIPPIKLYHGTSKNNLNQILKHGLKKMNRLHVHLSKDYETAYNVGKRHGGDTIVFEIDSKQMYKDKILFYLSENNVYLTDYIKPKYIKIVKK